MALRAVSIAPSSGGTAGVSTFNGRAGAVVLSVADVTTAFPGSTTPPIMDGTQTIGTANTWAHGDHIHPSDTSRLALAGGTMTGALTLAADPGANLQPVTLQYFNAHVPTVPAASSTLPSMDAVAAVGVGTTWARADHVHPSDTTRLTQAQGDARYLQLTGGAISGAVTAPTPVTTDNSTNVATTAFVKAALASGASLTISDTAPATPNPGALWFDSVGAQTYLWYPDPNTSQWVPVNAPPSSTVSYLPTAGGTMTGPITQPTAPVAGTDVTNKTYVDTFAGNNTGRNLIHNPVYTVQQRGAGSWSSGYTADRWAIGVSSDTFSASIVTLADADRASLGDESARFAMQCAVTGTAGAGAYSFLYQAAEGVRRLSNRTVTVSFWAKAASGTPRVGVSLLQAFGSGGSPSAAVPGTGQAVTLSTTWARYSVTATLTSVAGKTLGTNGDDSTNLELWLSGGSNFTTRSGIGVQSATVQFWGIQLEYGPVATPLARRDPADELALCQRFYQTSNISVWGYAANSQDMSRNWFIRFAVQMRATPTVTVAGSGFTVSVDQVLPTDIRASYTTTGTTSSYYITGFTASADL